MKPAASEADLTASVPLSDWERGMPVGRGEVGGDAVGYRCAGRSIPPV